MKSIHAESFELQSKRAIHQRGAESVPAIDPCIDNFPHVVTLMRRSPAALKEFLQHDALPDLRHVKHSPPFDSRALTVPRNTPLVAQEPRFSVLNPVVVRFEYAHAAGVAHLNQTFVRDREPQDLVDV